MPHTVQDDFEHFLAYSGFAVETEEVKTKLFQAYEANWNCTTCAAKQAEILALHRKLASERLRADQGWSRYEGANRDRNSARNELAESRHTNQSSDMRIEELELLVNSMQAEIDRLMLEFCPDEMTPAQMATWEASQRVVPNSKRVELKPMTEDDGSIRQWYFDCNSHYIDVAKDENGKYSIFFRDHSDQSEGWLDQAETTQEELDAARYRWLRDLKANSFSLTCNDDHAINYVTAKEWIEEYSPDDFSNDSESEIQAMKDTNTIWRLQVYPYTPIGFNFWNGATLDFVIEAAISAQIAKEDK